MRENIKGSTAANHEAPKDSISQAHDSDCLIFEQVTILTTRGGLALAKTWLADGSITDYAGPRHFTLEQRPVDNLLSLHNLLEELRERTDSCVIRGEPRDTIADPENLPGFYQRRKSNFIDVARSWVMFDVDGYDCEWAADPAAAFSAWVKAILPAEFHAAAFVWQLSGSAGRKPGLRGHVWFWLRQPMTSTDLRAWATVYEVKVDRSVLDSVQVHYTADPIMGEGVADPIWDRMDYVDGQPDVLISYDPARVMAVAERSLRGLKDPREKTGLIGAFCRTFSPEDVLNAEWFTGSFEHVRGERWTWRDGGGTPEGVRVTPTHLINVHNSAPQDTISHAQNAFDVLRLYQFGHLDSDEDAWAYNTPQSRPSYQAAKKFAESLPEVVVTRKDLTDAGNVNVLAELVDGTLRYVHENGSWLSWDAGRWNADSTGASAQAAAVLVGEHYYQLARVLHQQAENLPPADRTRMVKSAQNMEKYAHYCRSAKGIGNLLTLAKRDARFIISLADLDRDPWLLGVDNGVVNLRTGEIHPDSREDFVTCRAPARFNPAALAPNWKRFIEEITATPKAGKSHIPRPGLANYLQRALGYAATGLTREHKMFIAVGDGANGKNILLDMVRFTLGTYCRALAPEALMAGKQNADPERPTPAMRQLAGIRMAVASEAKDGQQLDVAMLKRHTGDSTMTARGMRENVFQFEITHKLWLMTNHLPRLDHLDGATRGRLHVIPFEMQWNRPGVPERDPSKPDGDKHLAETLRAESEGVLAWLVEGARLYCRDGLEPPPEVSRMTQDYFQGQDVFSQWLETKERCAPITKASDLHGSFQTWAHADFGNPGMSLKAFSKRLKDDGVSSKDASVGTLYGLR
jgi:P4 family phage/plasmid primase-like protien